MEAGSVAVDKLETLVRMLEPHEAAADLEGADQVHRPALPGRPEGHLLRSIAKTASSAW